MTVKEGRYRHFKGNLYRVEGAARHSETGEELVIYRQLYGERGLWARPAEMWGEHVDKPGYSGPRFTPEEEPAEPRRYNVVTLCGSTRFKAEYEYWQKQLTLQGCIVISVGLFGHSGDPLTEAEKVMLDDMHKRKILMADEIFVINKDGYIGASTRSEIDFARRNRIPVRYMEP